MSLELFAALPRILYHLSRIWKYWVLQRGAIVSLGTVPGHSTSHLPSGKLYHFRTLLKTHSQFLCLPLCVHAELRSDHFVKVDGEFGGTSQEILAGDMLEVCDERPRPVGHVGAESAVFDDEIHGRVCWVGVCPGIRVQWKGWGDV
jgi:hypothetical protein